MMDDTSLTVRTGTTWLLPFGTLMTLLLVVCVLLLSMSQLDRNRFVEATSSVRAAFGLGEFVERAKTGETGGMDFQQAVLLVRLKEKLETMLAGMGQAKGMDVVPVEEGFLVRLAQEAIFAPNSLTIRPEARPVLMQMAAMFAKVPNVIRVEAHASDQPPAASAPFAGNWVMTAAWAAALADFLVTEGKVDPLRLVVKGMGAHYPREPNTTPEGRAHNQRIEILLTRELRTPDKPSVSPPPQQDPASRQ
ncbi:MAG: OmpA family protein [Magnetococcales bacterium]|nr:OmpA family protein [Magnetococcales bacterium]